VAFGRLDALAPGFAQAAEVARRHGLGPVVRIVGGHAAVYDERCVAVEHVTAEADVTAGLQDRFAAQSRRLRRVLAELGADARVGELPGEYCAGAHSINAGGRIKVAGIAQRAIRHGAMTSAIVVVGGGADLRRAVAAVYGALEIDVDPATAGSLDEVVPGSAAEDVARRVQESYAADRRLRPRGLDPELIAAAHALADRHRAP
jgi:lipoate-protein ligase A